MPLDFFSVVPLSKLCSIKIAISIYNDPEMKSLEKTYDLMNNFPNKKDREQYVKCNFGFYRCSEWKGEIPSHLNELDFPPLRRSETYKCFCVRDIARDSLWTVNDQAECNFLYAQWKNLVLKKIALLPMPKLLQREVLFFVRYIRLEIKKWMSNHRRILRCFEEPTSFHWKSSGKINYEETAKALIRNEKLDIRTRYALASFNYLKDDAIYLWSKERMSWGVKYLISHDHPCLKIWNNCMKRRSAIEWDNLADNRTGFDIGILDDSSESWHSHYHLGIRTVFTKLATDKKIEWLNYSIKYETIDSEDFLFCLSHLKAHQEKESIFRENPCQVLGYFLDWPLQSEFLEVAENMWSFLSGSIFFFLLHFIIYERILKEWDDYDYFYLLREFWRQSPIHLKECIKLKNIYQVVMLAIDCDDTSSFHEQEIVQYCDNIYFAFHFPRRKSIS
ncbi:uncharacterized protein NPIL_221711 [Nephila pilipes]|uniref:Uncharacterized protein n=1 Tax=Nephila pilipes TaxID=299642 RepID=A0A8X6PIQ1_NEPPI|nr:uncharacterized protein NPIL_291181 [Nephila pilipes]GFT57169.1 uncharacterized protein NPIL_584971 [Nephila pilipes]GFT72883.1 uncharacterized protein NPIL_694511 [Nephila pilipes]GFT93392.1 uncharacterized protein NPIL_221711 [Nephila pilipes]